MQCYKNTSSYPLPCALIDLSLFVTFWAIPLPGYGSKLQVGQMKPFYFTVRVITTTTNSSCTLC